MSVNELIVQLQDEAGSFAFNAGDQECLRRACQNASQHLEHAAMCPADWDRLKAELDRAEAIARRYRESQR
jgi:mannose/cellobiose epimerase-like protein (N-acyl-D-glucosamine 2-epimerase family)